MTATVPTSPDLSTDDSSSPNYKTGHKVLLIDDSDRGAQMLESTLRTAGYEVTRARPGRQALVGATTSDIVLVDLDMADVDGLELLRLLRATSASRAVLALSANPREGAAVDALLAGADDFLLKPGQLGELLARISAVSRRCVAFAVHHVVVVGRISVDLDAHSVSVDDATVRLTSTQFALLACLARRAGRGVSRQQLMSEVWGETYAAVSRSLDVHIVALRNLLGRPKELKTIHGFGYCLSAD